MSELLELAKWLHLQLKESPDPEELEVLRQRVEHLELANTGLSLAYQRALKEVQTLQSLNSEQAQDLEEERGRVADLALGEGYDRAALQERLERAVRMRSYWFKESKRLYRDLKAVTQERDALLAELHREIDQHLKEGP